MEPSPKTKRTLTYFATLTGIVLFFIFASIIFIMISAGSIVAGDLVNQFSADDNPYELVLNQEIFEQLENNNVNERINNVPIPRLIKITIEEILAYYNIKDDFTDYSTGETVMMWDYVSAIDLVEPMVIYLKSLESSKIKPQNIEELVTNILNLPDLTDFIKNITGIEKITKSDIEAIIYRPLDGYEFYLPGTGGILERYQKFLELETGSYVTNSLFYYNFYDMKRRTLNIDDYYQVDQPYSTHPFASAGHCDDWNYDHNNIASSACGPISYAMVVSYFQKLYNNGEFPNGNINLPDSYIQKYSPVYEVEEVVYSICPYHPEGEGSSMYRIITATELEDLYKVRFSSAYGSYPPIGGVKSVATLTAFAQWVYEEIYQGHPIIFHAFGVTSVEEWDDRPESAIAFEMYYLPYIGLTRGGHYIVCHGFDINGNLIITDPARPLWGEGYTYGWKEALNQIVRAFSFESTEE